MAKKIVKKKEVSNMLDGYKSYIGAALIGAVPVLLYFDFSFFTPEIASQVLIPVATALLGGGIAHKLEKLINAMKE